ncbi:MAG: 50S ribosomal protein L3 [Candidatus Competibacteraceae bacterium]|nr:50S ribosomal protein L3 [Candidatus Competibacteraceae bacterium]
MKGILGIKLGMTQIFEEDGRVVPVTVVKAGPCLVVQRKTTDTDGYEAVQIGLVEEKAPRQVTKPLRGHFEKAGVPPTRNLMEFRTEADDPAKAGDAVSATVFATNDYVDVIGTSKGKGFQGVIKRHGFGGGRATHGSMFHRAPGSIGSSAFPSRVFPGLRAAGRMGGARVTVKNLQVVKINEEENLIYLRGAVPGARNSYVALREAKRG